jgi:hypothetical protein
MFEVIITKDAMARLESAGPMLRCGIHTFEHRFLFFFDGRKIILTHGFLKKDDAIDEREIARAERFHRDYFHGGAHE